VAAMMLCTKYIPPETNRLKQNLRWHKCHLHYKSVHAVDEVIQGQFKS